MAKGSAKTRARAGKNCCAYRLPSGENVRVRSVGKFYRVFAFTIDVEVTYTFYKLEKKKKRQAETAFAVPAAGGALRA